MMGLARELGMTLGDLSQRMSSSELIDWVVLSRIESEEQDEQVTREDLVRRASESTARTKSKLKALYRVHTIDAANRGFINDKHLLISKQSKHRLH